MRRTESIAILAVLALSLLGCRADNTAKETEQPDPGKSVPASEAPLPAPKSPETTSDDKRPLIVCFGDSLTAGYGTDPGKSYPDYLQTDLDAKGYQYRVLNEGVSGNTTKDGVDRLDHVQHGDVLRCAAESVAALRAGHGMQNAGPSQGVQVLGQVCLR